MSGKCDECEQGLPEWIMSYADMITILMAFFVVMYSMAGAPKAQSKEEAVFESFRERFGPVWHGFTALGPGPYIRKDSPLGKLASTGGARSGGKKSGGPDARATIVDHPRVPTSRSGEHAVVGGILYFPEGSSEVTKEHLEQLRLANEELSGKPQKIEIRGHTSRRPVPKGSPYRDNWDLAYARCRHTVEQLISLGIDPKRLRISLAADNEPIAWHIDPALRGQNSRVEVFMLNEVMDGLPQSHEQESSTTPAANQP